MSMSTTSNSWRAPLSSSRPRESSSPGCSTGAPLVTMCTPGTSVARIMDARLRLGSSERRSSLNPGLSSIPKCWCSCGRRRSAPTSRTLRPDSANATPRFAVVVVFDSPLPGDTMSTTLPASVRLVGAGRLPLLRRDARAATTSRGCAETSNAVRRLRKDSAASDSGLVLVTRDRVERSLLRKSGISASTGSSSFVSSCSRVRILVSKRASTERSDHTHEGAHDRSDRQPRLRAGRSARRRPRPVGSCRSWPGTASAWRSCRASEFSAYCPAIVSRADGVSDAEAELCLDSLSTTSSAAATSRRVLGVGLPSSRPPPRRRTRPQPSTARSGSDDVARYREPVELDIGHRLDRSPDRTFVDAELACSRQPDTFRSCDERSASQGGRFPGLSGSNQRVGRRVARARRRRRQQRCEESDRGERDDDRPPVAEGSEVVDGFHNPDLVTVIYSGALRPHWELESHGDRGAPTAGSRRHSVDRATRPLQGTTPLRDQDHVC